MRDIAVPPEVLHRPAAPQAPRTVNALRLALQDRRFFWTVEFIPSTQKVLRDDFTKIEELASAVGVMPLLAGFGVTDRVVSDRDPDPIAGAAHLLHRTGKQPLVHLSGKGREIGDLAATLVRLRENGLENTLMLTGDRLREEPVGERARYLESVPAIAMAKNFSSDLFVGSVVNPFKYREEDAMAQYLKLGKKIAAGSDFVITQVGFDIVKHEELVYWLNGNDYNIPIIANLMPMTAARARYIRVHQLPGVTVTDSFLSLLEADEQLTSDRGAARVLRRLALQIVGVRYLGYSGVQLTGIHSLARIKQLQAVVRECAEICPDRVTWRRAWEEACTLPMGDRADLAPRGTAWYFLKGEDRVASKREIAKFQLMNWIHDNLFVRGAVARGFGAMVSGVERRSLTGRVLERVERGVKGPIFGCETCGLCRLPATQYVCPETCPKGLANGPCGGTTDNLCEFRDRECIHSKKYRIAKSAGRLDELANLLIPAVPPEIRHTSSFPPHFRGEGLMVCSSPRPEPHPSEKIFEKEVSPGSTVSTNSTQV